jgi:hypothetical protein
MPRGDKVIRKQMYIDNEQDKQIKEIAAELGTTQTDVFRRAITYYLMKRKEERKKNK